MPVPFPTRYIIYDLETTGLDPKRDEAVEIGALKVDGENVEARSWLLKASVPMCEEAARITGITQEELDRDGRPPHECWQEFAAFIGIGRFDIASREFIVQTPPDGLLPLIGHNISRFDNRFVATALSKYIRESIAFPMMGVIDTAALYKGQMLRMPQQEKEDHMNYARRILSIYAKGIRYKLTEVFAECGGKLEGMEAHRAAADVHMTNFIYRKFARLDVQSTQEETAGEKSHAAPNS